MKTMLVVFLLISPCWTVDHETGRPVYRCHYAFDPFMQWMTEAWTHTKPDFWKEWRRSDNVEDRRKWKPTNQ